MKILFACVPAAGHFNPLTASARLTRVLRPSYRRNVARVRAEIASYSPHDIVDEHLAALVPAERVS